MPSPGYQYLTLGAARSILARRLEDAGQTYWSAGPPNELNLAIAEAVQSWQAFTASYKQRASFSTAAATPFYDLASVLSPACLAYTATDQLLVTQILAHLLEPVLSATWVGTGQFAFAQIMSAIASRRDRFLSESGCVITRVTQPFGAGPPVARDFLPDSVLDVTRAAWTNVAGKPTVLWRDDAFANAAFSRGGFGTPTDPPQTYSLFIAPPVGIDVFPPPLNNGSLDLLTVSSGPALGTTPLAVFTTPVPLGIPDAFAFGVKYGALSDLLSADGPARDPERAAYCEQRYAEAVVLAHVNPSVLATRVNGVPVWTDSIFELDAFSNSWQAVAGAPQAAGLAGRNLLALGPIANGVFGVTVDVVSNMPALVADGDEIQVDRGAADPILDESQHIASLKMAGAEFQATSKLHANFVQAAATVNARIKNLAFYQSIMYSLNEKQGKEVVRV